MLHGGGAVDLIPRRAGSSVLLRGRAARWRELRALAIARLCVALDCAASRWPRRQRQNIEDQLERLLSQLADSDELKAELSDEEYQSEKKSTLEQLTEFQATLEKMTAGSVSLTTQYDAAKLAVRAAISDAFKTPEVIRLFARKEPAALRLKLSNLDRDVKLGKFALADVAPQVCEILTALKKLGEPLDAKEEAFLASQTTAGSSLADFVAVSDSVEDVDTGGAPTL